MRVLIVEDEFLLRDELARMLTAAGYDTLQAGNGRVALEQMRRDKPDLVLLDLAMPVMNGENFRTEQLKDPTLAAIPVVLVSGHADAAQVRALKAAAYVAKPVQEATLLAVLRQFGSASR
jgi:DNA-binding response OmpR family regulator